MLQFNRFYVDGAFVEPHGHDQLDLVDPSTETIRARVTLGDREDARRAVEAPGGRSPASAGPRPPSASRSCAACTRP